MPPRGRNRRPKRGLSGAFIVMAIMSLLYSGVFPLFRLFDYAVLALVMLIVGGMQAYTVVWDLGDVGIGLMTIFNMLALYPLSGEALTALREYEAKKKLK